MLLLSACDASPANSHRAPEPGGPTVDYLVIADDALADSASRWGEFRSSSGYSVEVLTLSQVSADSSRSALVDAIAQTVESRFSKRDPQRPFFLLLIGDATAASGLPPGTFSSPTDGAVTSDNVYADIDGDTIPDLAVGRIPAADNATVDSLRERTAAYESSYAAGQWNRRFNIFASTAGFGEPLDSLVESTAFDIVESIPPAYDLTMTYADQSSPYVYVPDQFSDKVYERINEGALMVAYVGHGSPGGFADLTWSSTSYPILDTSQLDNVAVTHRAPILTFIACATGDFVDYDSVSEQILAMPGAPPAVLSSTEVSNPLPNAIFIYELAHTLTDEAPATLGEAFMRAKERMFYNDDALRQQFATYANLWLGAATVENLYESHAHMYTLFGDPALHITYAGQGSIEAPVTTSAGATLAFTANLGSLGAGNAHVTLESQRKVILGDIAPVPADGDPSRDAVIETNYATANDKVVATVDLSHSDGTLAGSIDVPADLPSGTYYLKLYADDGTDDVLAGTAVVVP